MLSLNALLAGAVKMDEEVEQERTASSDSFGSLDPTEGISHCIHCIFTFPITELTFPRHQDSDDAPLPFHFSHFLWKNIKYLIVICNTAAEDNLVDTYSRILRDVIEEGDDAEIVRAAPNGNEIPALDWASIQLPGNLW